MPRRQRLGTRRTHAIARIWRARTELQRAGAYETLLRTEVFPTLRHIEGFAGGDLLRHESGPEVEFAVITSFESLDALRRFAGDDAEQAIVSTRVGQLLSRFDSRCRHFELIARAAVKV